MHSSKCWKAFECLEAIRFPVAASLRAALQAVAAVVLAALAVGRAPRPGRAAHLFDSRWQLLWDWCSGFVELAMKVPVQPEPAIPVDDLCVFRFKIKHRIFGINWSQKHNIYILIFIITKHWLSRWDDISCEGAASAGTVIAWTCNAGGTFCAFLESKWTIVLLGFIDP